jgi:hypothetical protein
MSNYDRQWERQLSNDWERLNATCEVHDDQPEDCPVCSGELSESDHICWVDDTVCESCSTREHNVRVLHDSGNHSRCDSTSD